LNHGEKIIINKHLFVLDLIYRLFRIVHWSNRDFLWYNQIITYEKMMGIFGLGHRKFIFPQRPGFVLIKKINFLHKIKVHFNN
jgi:hypothetical protein